jgi:hypothetical protein
VPRRIAADAMRHTTAAIQKKGIELDAIPYLTSASSYQFDGT